MNRKFFLWPLAAVLLTACEKGLEETVDSGDSGQVTNSMLQVRTRGASPGDEATVAYPLQVYVFSGDVCKAAQTIGDDGQTLNIPLTEGTYTVYAVGGASSSDYILPTTDDATTTTAITLREGHEHGDLMAASATTTLVDGGTNTVTLGLTRKTMLIQSVEINKVPTAATAVSVSIAPLWQLLTVSGNFSTAGTSHTIALTKQSDNRTWLSTDDVHLLPPNSQPASVSVNITIGGTTKTYTYSTSDQLEEGYEININGTYTEAVGVSLTGTISGATWLGERTISFNFDENGSTTSENNPSPGNNNPSNNPSNFPATGDTYEGCYVLAVTVAIDGESAELTLLSPNEKKYTNVAGISLDYLQTKAAEQGFGDISGWRLMTTAEAQLLQAAHTELSIADSRYYLFDDNDTPKQMLMSNGATSALSSGDVYIRPVATVTINNE